MSPSVSSGSSNPRRLANESSILLLVNCAAVGGDGVANGADDVAVEPDGARRARPGVENPETIEPRESSGCVPIDCIDVSARFIAADMLAGATDGSLSVADEVHAGRVCSSLTQALNSHRESVMRPLIPHLE